MIANGIAWPNGARCAACLTFDMDADSLIHVAYPGDGHTKVSAISHFRYGRWGAPAPGFRSSRRSSRRPMPMAASGGR